MGASVLLLLAGVAWPLAIDAVAVRPDLERRLNTAEDVLLDARTIRNEIDAVRGNRSQFAVEAQDLERQLVTLQSLLPAAADRGAAYALLRKEAAASGVDLLALDERPSRELPTCRGVALEATLEGPTDAVLDLAERMTHRAAQTVLSRLELTAPGRPGKGRAKIEIILLDLPVETRESDRPGDNQDATPKARK
jgi:hypothetical protein